MLILRVFTFHCLTRDDLTLFDGFCGFLVCLSCLCVGGLLFVCACVAFLVWVSPHDFGIILLSSRTNDRRSCHGVHGKGEKKK